MTKSLAAQLEESKQLIDSPEKWCQQVLARVSGEKQISLLFADEAEIQRCMLGAVIEAFVEEGEERLQEAEGFLRRACVKLGFKGISEANDKGPRSIAHPRVMRIFDIAIASAKEAAG